MLAEQTIIWTVNCGMITRIVNYGMIIVIDNCGMITVTDNCSMITSYAVVSTFATILVILLSSVQLLKI